MARHMISLLAATWTLTLPTGLSAQDWTFEVPMQLEGLTSDVESVMVTCKVYETPMSDYQGAEDLWLHGSTPIGTSVSLTPDATGAVAQTAVVELSAPNLTDAEKRAMRSWACGMLLHSSLQQGNSRPREGTPEQAEAMGVPLAAMAQPGSLVGFVGGSLPGSGS